MPKASVNQTSFSSGEVSPLYYGRVDEPKYKQGMSTTLNYIPTLQGALLRRPATKYLTTVKDSTKPPVFIPFQFSITQAYMLEVGDQYIRFYANNAQIVTSGTSYQVTGTDVNTMAFSFTATRSNTVPLSGEVITGSTSVSTGTYLELVTPYAWTDVPLLRFAQDADTVYLVHPSYPVFKLQRYGQTYWTLKQVQFKDGPYLPLNSYQSLGDYVGQGLQVASGSGNQQVQSAQVGTVVGALAGPGGVVIEIFTSSPHGLVTGQKVFITGIVGTTEANNYSVSNPSAPWDWTVTVVSTTSFTLNGSTFVHAWNSGGVVYNSFFSSNQYTAPGLGTVYADFGRNIALLIGGERYWGVIVAVNGAATVVMNIDPTCPAIPSSPTVTAWQLGVYAWNNGFPSCVCFHQQRLVLGAPPSYPQEIDGSYVGSYENFSPSPQATLAVTAANAYQFTLSSNDVNALKWLKSNAQGLLAGSYSAEWLLAASTQAEALSPLNVNAVATSFYGSYAADAVQIGNSAIYIDRAGRKVRELSYVWQIATFKSTDVSELSEHITLPQVTKLCVQKGTIPLIWAMRSDGNLVSLTFDRDGQEFAAGWARHQLGGQSDPNGTNPIVYSMGVIPSADLSFDQLWLIVKRYIDGSYQYMVEYMTKIYDDSILQEDAFQGDCGGTYDNPFNVSGVSNTSPGVVTTSTPHGFSTGQQVRFENIIGFNYTTYDVDGNPTVNNYINGITFTVGATVTSTTFTLNDVNNNPVNTSAWGPYVSGGQVRAFISLITNASFLDGETVGVLTDGGNHPDVTISNIGHLQLQYPATKVQFGYRFNSDAQLLRPDTGSADGTSIGKTRRIHRLAFMLRKVGSFFFGTNFNKLLQTNFMSSDVTNFDTTLSSFSGIVRVFPEADYNFDGQTCFRQSSMLPGTVQSITTILEEFDV